MNIQRAKDLLERLRARTEARGATAAEAAQAAELAEKICERYGLNLHPEQAEVRFAIREKRLPMWANVLCMALEKRFKITGGYETHVGRPVVLVFTGPEHLTGIAVWLFKAIRKDLDKRSYIAARAMGKKSGELLRFRNLFRAAAAWEIADRLNPPPPTKPMTQEEIDALQDEFNGKYGEKIKRMTKGERDREFNKVLAEQYGRKAGREISIDTNVIGNENESTMRLEHHCSGGGE